jgi:hypothetical protein
LAGAVDVAVFVVGLTAEPAGERMVGVHSSGWLRDGFIEPHIEGESVAEEAHLSDQGMGG